MKQPSFQGSSPAQKSEGGKRLPVFQILTEYLEYILALVVIAECNSLFTNSVSEAGNYSQPQFLMLGAGTAAVLILLLFLSDGRCRRALPDLLLFPALLFAYSLMFFVLNVRATSDSYTQRLYLIIFSFSLPAFCLLFRMEKRQCRSSALFLRHADLMFIFALLSLVVYLVVTFFPDNIYADDLRTRWIGVGNITHLNNYLNLCVLRMSDSRSILGLVIHRNYGFFPESPMFSLELNTALYTELFLRPESSRKPLRWIVLSLAVISSQSTFGMMLVLMAWFLKFLFGSTSEFRKKMLFPAAFLFAAGCGILLMHKLGEAGVSEGSFAIHLEDYVLTLKAFSKRPLLGWGYENIRPVQALMSEERYAANRGLSNSLGVVLAQGGLVLGLFCMLPFLFAILQLWCKGRRSTGLWGIGTFAMYVLIIFQYHLLLIMFMAFGYSFPTLCRDEKTGKLCLSLAEIIPEEDPGPGVPASPETPQSVPLFHVGIPMLLLLFFCLCAPFWAAIYRLFLLRRLYLGQSTFRFFFVTAALILFILVLRHSVCSFIKTPSAAALFPVFCVSVSTIGFLMVEDKVSSHVQTILTLAGSTSDYRENFILFSVYFLTMLIPLTVCSIPGILRRHVPAAAAAAVCLTALCLTISVKAAEAPLPDRSPVREKEQKILLEIASAADGKVYSDLLPSLYFRSLPGFQYPVSRGIGYAESAATTILVSSDKDLRACFRNGFEAVRLTSEHLLYTNDRGVLARLKELDASAYRYYPCTSYVNLNYEARRNRLRQSENGTVWVDGASASMEYGPGWECEPGDYTAQYDLLFDNTGIQNRELVGKIRISHDNGTGIIVFRDVYSDEFSEGKLTAVIPFTAEEWDDLEFSFFGQGEYSVGVASISLRQTPRYITVSELNGRRLPIREDYFKTDGEPYTMAAGYTGRELSYDRAGNLTGFFCHNSEHQPVLTKDGWAGVRYGYNDRSLVNYECWLGTDKKPILLPDGYSAVRKKHDAFGHVNELYYFDENDNPVRSAAGYAGIRMEFDSDGRRIAEDYFDVDGELLSGCARCEWEYNDADDAVAVRYFDADRLPFLNSDGYAEVRRKHNNKHRIIREAYYGTDGGLILQNGGYAVMEQDYDDNGNIVLQRYFGTTEEPILMSAGYAEVRRKFNLQRQLTEESYFGPTGAPVALPQGYSVSQREYDEAGNVIVQRYCGGDRTPVITSWGYAEVRREFNDLKRVTREQYYDTNGMPVCLMQGYAGQKYAYSGSRISEIAYLDSEGRQILRTDGYAELKRSYNSDGQIISETYYDLSHMPVPNASGYAEVRKTYNSLGKLEEESYYGPDGNPVLTAAGYAFQKYAYDDIGNPVQCSYYDTEHIPVLNKNGYAQVKREYNNSRKITRESYFGSDGKAVLSAGGYSVLTREYDEYGDNTVISYLDEEGTPVTASSGCAEIHRVFNPEHRLIKETFCGTDGKITTLKPGHSIQTIEYDALGNSAVYHYLNRQEQPVLRSDGFAEMRREYNNRRQLVCESYHGLKGEPVNCTSGYAVVRKEYGADGKLSAQYYFDADGNPVIR